MARRQQQRSPMERYGIRDFERDFPDDAACLEWLRDYLYPEGIYCDSDRCKTVTKHHRVRSRPSYSCDRCGRHEHPMAGTIFQDSRTPLRLWFRAIFLMAQTRCGISAKQLERELGVTYKTAYRMFKLIRSLLAEDVTDLDGEVEIDETYIGGKPRYRQGKALPGTHSQRVKAAMESKVQVQGMVERGGRVRAIVNPTHPLAGNVQQFVLPSAFVFTDEAMHYRRLGRDGYAHRRVHHAKKIYVFGNAHTNTIEGFWSLVKRGISGVYHNVSEKHLQMYFDEYGFRYNHRMDVTPMFQTFLSQIAKASAD